VDLIRRLDRLEQDKHADSRDDRLRAYERELVEVRDQLNNLRVDAY